MRDSQKKAIKKYAQSDKGKASASKSKDKRKETHKFLGFWVPIEYVDVVKKCVSRLVNKD